MFDEDFSLQKEDNYFLKKTFVLFFCSLMLLSVLDCISTLLCLFAGFEEGNPILAFVFGKIGIESGIVFMLFYQMAIIFCFFAFPIAVNDLLIKLRKKFTGRIYFRNCLFISGGQFLALAYLAKLFVPAIIGNFLLFFGR